MIIIVLNYDKYHQYYHLICSLYTKQFTEKVSYLNRFNLNPTKQIYCHLIIIMIVFIKYNKCINYLAPEHLIGTNSKRPPVNGIRVTR